MLAPTGAAASSSGHVEPQQVPQLEQLLSTASYILANRGLALVPAAQMSHHFLQHMCLALRECSFLNVSDICFMSSDTEEDRRASGIS